MSASLRVGEPAPRFSLPADDGSTVSLESLLAKGPVVVFFYPRDETAGCTAQACAFRDSYEVFQEAGASVVGISSDSVASHRRFRDKHGFPYVLLADEGGRVRESFGVPRTLGILDGRSTYVIAKDGVVRHVFHSQLRATKHVDEAVAAVRALA